MTAYCTRTNKLQIELSPLKTTKAVSAREAIGELKLKKKRDIVVEEIPFETNTHEVNGVLRDKEEGATSTAITRKGERDRHRKVMFLMIITPHVYYIF